MVTILNTWLQVCVPSLSHSLCLCMRSAMYPRLGSFLFPFNDIESVPFLHPIQKKATILRTLSRQAHTGRDNDLTTAEPAVWHLELIVLPPPTLILV